MSRRRPRQRRMADPLLIDTMAQVKHQQVYGMAPKDQRRDSGKSILIWAILATVGLIIFLFLLSFFWPEISGLQEYPLILFPDKLSNIVTYCLRC